MVLTDVNVLVYAHPEDSPEYRSYRTWLENLICGDAAYAVSGLVLSGFLRVVTHPKVFKFWIPQPSPPLTRPISAHQHVAVEIRPERGIVLQQQIPLADRNVLSPHRLVALFL